jgi:hypothetical protein
LQRTCHVVAQHRRKPPQQGIACGFRQAFLGVLGWGNFGPRSLLKLSFQESLFPAGINGSTRFQKNHL